MRATCIVGVWCLFFVFAWGQAQGQEMVLKNTTRPIMDEAVTAYNPENSEYNPQNSPYNPDNSEYNPANSEYNVSNSPYNPANTAYNPQNSPYNPDNSEYNPSRVTGVYEENATILAVPRAGGGVNIFDKSGNLIAYSTASGQVFTLRGQTAAVAPKPAKPAEVNQAAQKPEDNLTREDQTSAQPEDYLVSQEDSIRDHLKVPSMFDESTQ